MNIKEIIIILLQILYIYIQIIIYLGLKNK